MESDGPVCMLVCGARVFVAFRSGRWVIRASVLLLLPWRWDLMSLKNLNPTRPRMFPHRTPHHHLPTTALSLFQFALNSLEY